MQKFGVTKPEAKMSHFGFRFCSILIGQSPTGPENWTSEGSSYGKQLELKAEIYIMPPMPPMQAVANGG